MDYRSGGERRGTASPAESREDEPAVAEERRKPAEDQGVIAEQMRLSAEVARYEADRQDLIALAHDWDRAMVQNDAEVIGGFMADDWIIIGPDGRIGDRATFLALVASGALSHDLMESDDLEVRRYGDTAVMILRGVSGGTFQGQPFREVERVSCVFVRKDGRWRCVLTHLSRLET